MTITSGSSNTLLVRRLYRSLLQESKPFVSPSRDAAVLSSLLHRASVGLSRDMWDSLTKSRPVDQSGLEEPLPKELARDLSRGYNELRKDYDDGISLSWSPLDEFSPHRLLFRWLLQEVVAGHPDESLGSDRSPRLQNFPSQIDTMRLRDVIRREFRFGKDAMSPRFDEKTRHQVAFTAIQALNSKLSFAESLGILNTSHTNEEQRKVRNRRQRARNVSLLPLEPTSYLRAGAYLVAHPLLTGIFSRTVICLMDHTESSNGNGGTYGLIVNKQTGPKKDETWTIGDVIQPDSLSPKLIEAFATSTVREGGPVHVSLQMVHACNPEQGVDLQVGGSVLPMLHDSDDAESSAINSDRAIYYQGDIEKAAEAIIVGEMVQNDISFYVGASCWTSGQLEEEIDRGYWIPVRGPPEIALTGLCEYEHSPSKGVDIADKPSGDDPQENMWLSMMCALGEDEANLAHLFLSEDDSNQSCDPCDDIVEY